MILPAPETPTLAFDLVRLHDLAAQPAEVVDALPYGVVGLSPDGLVRLYNRTESRLAGISSETVLGTHFFSEIGQCMNNFMVAQHYEDDERIDQTIDYVLTLRMRPTKVRLRMLKEPDAALSFLLIARV